MKRYLKYEYLKYSFMLLFVFAVFFNSILLPITAPENQKNVKATVVKKNNSPVIAEPVIQKKEAGEIDVEEDLEAMAAPTGQQKEKSVVSGMNDSVDVEGFDEKAYADCRKTDVKNLVDKAIKYLEKNSFGKAMNEFSYGKDFFIGELHLFVYDYDGVCLAHGNDHDYIWENRIDYKDTLGLSVTKMIIEKAKIGGGWINYQKKNATKVVYVRGVQKDGKRIIIGSGYYPLSKRDAVISLVRNAVESFNRDMRVGETTQAAFSEFSYPLGRFVVGDLYLFALDFKGKIVAQGDIQGIIGTNALDSKDETGKFINREIIEALQSKDKGVWIDYISKGAKKLTYAEQVIDRDGNKYFIACGYYPDSNRKAVVELVKKGYAFMSKSGLKAASIEFSERGKRDYRYGDLFLVVYDYKGKCMAHGSNRDFIGTNQYNVKDESGKYPVRQFIEKAKAGGGWVNYKVRNSYIFTYVEEITVGGVKYAIGSGTFPTSKPETMQLIVKDAAGSLRDFGAEKSFEQFVKKDGKFIKGDIEVFVFDFSGLCYVYGSDTNMIWRDMLDKKDDDGRQFVKLIINTAKEGSGTVVFKESGKLKTAYVMKVEKDGVSYAVGSSFFLK